MQTLEYNYQDFQKGHQSEADKGLLVKFFNKTVQDMRATEKEGRPIFHELVYVSIDVPGNRLGGACRPASQADIQRFPEHFNAFKNRTSNDGLVGMPLTEWPQITRSQAEELAYLKIKTVEQLAEVSDGNGSQIMNFYSLKAKAKAWLADAAERKSAEHLQAELAKRDAEIDELKAAVAALLNAPNRTAPVVEEAAEVPRETPKKTRRRKPSIKFVPEFARRADMTENN